MSVTTRPSTTDDRRVRAVPQVTTTNVRRITPSPADQARAALQTSMDTRQ
jgi:hypothetical protein